MLQKLKYKLFAAFCFIGFAFAARADIIRRPTPLPGHYIAVFSKGLQFAPATVVADLERAHGVKREFLYETAIKGFSFVGPEAAAQAISLDQRVRYVQEVGKGQIATTQTPIPCVPGGNCAWGLDRIDHPTGLDNAYDYSYTGQGIVLYVLDTGVNPISDLQGRIIDQQNFVNDTNGVSDCHGHGTKVATIAAGTTYGVAKNASIVNWRLADCNGQLFDNSTIAAIDAMTSRHLGAGTEGAVANCSWIFFGVSPGVEDSIRSAVLSGINVVTAAGNASTDACSFTPSRLGNPSYFNDPSGASLITVGATTSADAKQDSSNFGVCLDIFSPGLNTAAMNKYGVPENFSDTSAAVPHVAGVAALFLEQSPQIINNPSALEGLIKDNGVPNVLTNIGSGSPNLLLQNWVHRHRPCCSG